MLTWSSIRTRAAPRAILSQRVVRPFSSGLRYRRGGTVSDGRKYSIIAGLSRIAVWAGTVRDRLTDAALRLEMDAASLESASPAEAGAILAEAAERVRIVATIAHTVRNKAHTVVRLVWLDLPGESAEDERP